MFFDDIQQALYISPSGVCDGVDTLVLLPCERKICVFPHILRLRNWIIAAAILLCVFGAFSSLWNELLQEKKNHNKRKSYVYRMATMQIINLFKRNLSLITNLN